MLESSRLWQMLLLTIDKTVNLIKGTIMTEKISNKDLFYQIPQTKNDPLWVKIIEEMDNYAPPETVEGMKHHKREVLPVSKAVRKSGEKNSNINLTRFSNPDRDNLNTIETRGLNVTCYPPKTVITTEELKFKT